MKTAIKYIRLPFTFSEEKLVSELNALTHQWVQHFNKAHYEGDWSALPLRSVNGSLTNVLPENNNQGAFMNTVLMEQCPYIKSIIAQFPCEHKATRLLKLMPGAVIKEHKDNGLCFEEGEARIHIPITTNPQLEFYLDNERIIVKPGECWYMNFNLPHRITNNGSTARVHLVLDIMVNDAIREMFDRVYPPQKMIVDIKAEFSSLDNKNIISQLRLLNTPESIKLADQLETELI